MILKDGGGASPSFTRRKRGRAGIATGFFRNSLWCPILSVAENIFLGEIHYHSIEARRIGPRSVPRVPRTLHELGARRGEIDPNATVRSLSVAQQQTRGSCQGRSQFVRETLILGRALLRPLGLVEIERLHALLRSIVKGERPTPISLCFPQT